jgi:hypothetical protein
MPHAWIASDYIRSVLDMFVYERQSSKALVLAAGLHSEWLDGPGFSVSNLRTPYGSLSMSFKRQGSDVVVNVDGDAKPPGGFLLPWPTSHPNVRRSDGPLTWQDGELHFRSLPAQIAIGPRAAPQSASD